MKKRAIFEIAAAISIDYLILRRQVANSFFTLDNNLGSVRINSADGMCHTVFFSSRSTYDGQTPDNIEPPEGHRTAQLFQGRRRKMAKKNIWPLYFFACITAKRERDMGGTNAFSFTIFLCSQQQSATTLLFLFMLVVMIHEWCLTFECFICCLASAFLARSR